MKKTLIFLSFLLSWNFTSAQSMKAFIAAAENAMISEDYYSALVYYNNALEFDESRLDLKYNTAEAARLFNAYALAEEKYQTVVSNDGNMEYPMATYWLADVKQKQGKYVEAKELYDFYISENQGDDEYYSAKAEKESKACGWAIDLLENPDESIEITHLDENINTPYSEFGARKKDDYLYFSSLKFDQPDGPYNPDRYVSKVIKAKEFELGEVLDEDINHPTLHTAHNAFTADDSRVYYTICHFITANDIRCDLYYKNIMDDGSFGAEVKLPENINSTAFTCTQPATGKSPSGEEEVLYFVSDRPGGEGKNDVWYTKVMDNGDFSDPINLESINTAEDDITPFYHHETGLLYFSSEGYRGLGGFDIYVAEKDADNEYTVDMMSVPLNSSFHDIYYTVNDDRTEAFFSSNRSGSFYIESSKEACCFDIYKADMEEIILTLNALTFNSQSEELLGVTVRLIDLKTGEERMLTPQDINSHEFDLLTGRDYEIIAEKANYTSDTIQFNTRGIYKSQEILKNIYLETEFVELEVLTFDKGTKADLIGATVQLVNAETNEVVDELKNNRLSNRFAFFVEADKKYKIIGTKEDYSQDVAFIDTNGKSGKIFQELFLLKQDLKTYLPVVLYYDNDIPDRRSRSKTTKKSYSDTYFPYIAQKENFKTKFGMPLSGEARVISDQNLEYFFEDDVKGGFNKLNSFFVHLEKELMKGETVEIAIKGFASPRASNSYNQALSQRRIRAVVNEIHKFNNGNLVKFLFNEGLLIKDVSYGEEEAPSGISDDYNDRRNSIYSVEASRERRVEIVNVQYLSNN